MDHATDHHVEQRSSANLLCPVDAPTQNFSTALESFLSGKKLFDLIQAEARKAASLTKFNRNSADLIYFFSLNSMAIFADQVGCRELVLHQMKQDLQQQPFDVRSRRIAEVAVIVERLYRHADEQQKYQAFDFFTQTLWEDAKQIPDLAAQSRTTHTLLTQLAEIFRSQSLEAKHTAVTFIENTALPTIREGFRQKIDLCKNAEKRQGLLRLESQTLAGIVIANGTLHSSAQNPKELEGTHKTIERIASYAAKHILDPQIASETQAELSMCLLKLHAHSSLEYKRELITEVSIEEFLPSDKARFLQAASQCLASDPNPSSQTIQAIVDTALLPACSIADEKENTITISRIANHLAEMALRSSSGLIQEARQTLEDFKQNLDAASVIAYSQKSVYELNAKFSRAITSLSDPEAEGSLLAEVNALTADQNNIKEDADAFSRQIAGIAQNIALRKNNFSASIKHSLATVILNDLLPLVAQLPAKVIQDSYGQQFFDETAKCRAYSRIAISLAKMFSDEPFADRMDILTLIREKILTPMSRYAQLNKSYFTRVLRNYEACSELLRGADNDPVTWNNLIESEQSYGPITLFARQLSGRDRSELFVSLGAFSSQPVINSLLADSSLTNADKGAVIYGKLFFHETFPLNSQIRILHPVPNAEISLLQEKIDQGTITPSDKIRFSKYISAGQRAQSWGDIAELTAFAARNPEAHTNVLRSMLIALRLKQHTQDPSARNINIEQIPKLVMPGLSALFENQAAVSTLFPETRALVRALPLDSFLINEIRIESYKLFDDKLVPVQAQFLKVLRTVFHNLPSPRHLLVMRAFVEYLEDGSALSRKRIDNLLSSYQSQYSESILVPEDFIDQLGADKQQMLESAKKVRELYEDLYGEQQARTIIRTLLDRQHSKYTPSDITEKTKALLVSISRVNSLETISTSLAKSFKAAASYPPSALAAITRNLTELRQDIRAAMLSPDASGEARIYLLRLQNAFEPLVFSFLNSSREHWDRFSFEEQKSILSSTAQIAAQDLALGTEEHQELLFTIEDLKTVQPSKKNNRLYSVLHRLQRITGRIADNTVEHFQSRIEFESRKLDIDQRDIVEFSANLLRESTLYPLQLLLEQALEDPRINPNPSSWHITQIGTTNGRLLYIENPDDPEVFGKLRGDEILVLDHISVDLDFPKVKGIITRLGTTSLSHLAIHARQHRIPWATPPRKEYDSIVELARTHSQNEKEQHLSFSYIVTANKVSLSEALDGEEISPAVPLSSNKSGKPLLDLTQPSSFLLPASEYSEANVGAKAAKIGKLTQLLPDKVPAHTTLPFGAVESLLTTDPELQKLLLQLQEVSETNQIEAYLAKIRNLILCMELSTEQKEALHTIIDETFDPSDLLIARSSSSIEDAQDSPGAGDYASVVNHDRALLWNDIRCVIASLYSYKAYQERRYSHFDESSAKMAVTVQKLVATKAPAQQYGFVIHTHNPYSENPDEVLIEFTPGLGEALVSGEPKFAGDAHSFSFNRKTQVLTRVSYANKSYMIKPADKTPSLVDYREDPFSTSEIPFEASLRAICNDAIRIEAADSIGKNHPQDCEGVIVENQGLISHFFVQTRPQIQLENSFSEVSQSAEQPISENPLAILETVSLTTNPPIFHNNTLPLSSYDLPQEIFQHNTNANLISLWSQAFRTVLGDGKVVIVPIGSLSYMESDKKILWAHIDDFDLNFYLPDATTEWEAWQIEKEAMPKIIEVFKTLARSHNLQINEESNGAFSLHGTIEDAQRAYKMKPQNLRCLPLTAVTSEISHMRAPDGFLPWYNFYADTDSRIALDNLLITTRALTQSGIQTNVSKQYTYAYQRGMNPQEGGAERKLKEICRLGIILENQDLRHQALTLLNAYSAGTPSAVQTEAVEMLWGSLPKLGSEKLELQVQQYAEKTFHQSRQFISLLENSLARKRIHPSEDIFYSFSYLRKENNDVPATIANCLLLSHFRGGRFFLVDWSFKYYEDQVRINLAHKLRLLFPESSKEHAETQANRIITHRLMNFTHYYDPETMGQLFEQFPQLKGNSDVSHLDFMFAWLKEGNRFTGADTALIDHIDQGSVGGLFLLLHSKGSYSPQSLALLEDAFHIREKVEGTFDFVERRINGDLAKAQKMASAIEKVIKRVKPGTAPSEEDTRKLFLHGFEDTPDAFGQLIASFDAVLQNRPNLFVEQANRPTLEQLRGELKRGRKLHLQDKGLVSPLHTAFALSREEGFRDPNIQYAIAGQHAMVFVDFEPLKDSSGTTLGWRYLSIGRSPFHPSINLKPLINVLNSIEQQQRYDDLAYGQDKKSSWRGRAHSEMVIRGPSGTDQERQNFSLIPPEILLYVIEQHLLTFIIKH